METFSNEHDSQSCNLVVMGDRRRHCRVLLLMVVLLSFLLVLLLFLAVFPNPWDHANYWASNNRTLNPTLVECCT